uniref:Uncharacterized protein n=1 Tax=Knipowitschia caucasica TaxID=637954 RepID=A0AAV2LIG2_KNICA
MARRRAQLWGGVDQLPSTGLEVQIPRHNLCPEPAPRLGTGSRHSVKKQNWPTSSFVNKPCKWVIPPVSPDKKVCVLDFPPRLTLEVEVQQAFREEFCRVAARMGIGYFHVAEHFRLDRQMLWCWDGVHLSDDHGMGIYAELLSQACSQQLEKEVPSIVVPPSPSKSYTWRYKPKVVVVGPEPSPRPPPPEWTVVGQGRKVRTLKCFDINSWISLWN